ncbi:hypothetical protein ACH5RR_004493 [Cinchona calisaya]|uniref:Pre-rRNA-processing protein Ipi1 N-terminal domain-containing protein n=1 Tax=Cinchona calisaya TaxID=153742 RepID=A0ABD3AXQ0_9GENT
MGKEKKGQSKKQQKRGGIDFKKIKRKVGRKLPPPKNATNTEIKSKAIILPEQSVVSEKAGLAVSKKGLTLKELLQQTSHHNAKVRKDALIGIRDIFLKYPTELKLHKLATVEKLRERISDDDKLVRETLFQLFKSVVLPSCKEDNQGPFISLMMAYIFNSMTHLAIDVRLMAFKFFDLVVQYYPSSFSFYAEKILQNYQDILQKSQFHLQDKGKLKGILAGLVHCLRLLPCNTRYADSSVEKEVPSHGILHALEPDLIEDSSGHSGIIEKLKDLLPILISCFQDFTLSNHTMPLADSQSFDCVLFILQSIDVVVKFFVCEMKKTENVPSLYERGPDADVLDKVLSPAIFKKLWEVFPLNPVHRNSDKDDDRFLMLNTIITEIFLRLNEWNFPPAVLLENFLGFIENSLVEKLSNCTQSVRVLREKHLLPLVPFIPKLIMQVSVDWRSRIIQAFTEVFKNSGPESSMKLACLSVLEDVLDPEKGWLYLVVGDPELLDYQLMWIRELPPLLVILGDKNPLCSKAVLHLLLVIGKAAKLSFSFSQEYDQMQYTLSDFYSTHLDDGSVCYGPFMKLTQDIQELSLCCLYYFSSLESMLLQSLVSCCLCQDLEPILLFRIIEVLHSVYKAGNISSADHMSFLITLLSRFRVSTEDCPLRHETISNRATFRSIARVVCSCLSQIGDNNLVLQMLEKIILDQMTLKLPLDNICACLRVLITLDSKPTRLSEQSIIKLSHVLPKYLINVASSVPHDDESRASVSINNSHYYLLPCFFLFDRSTTLLDLFLTSMRSLITDDSSLLLSPHHTASKISHSSRLNAIVTLLLLMHEDVKMQQILLPHKAHSESILEIVLKLPSEEINTAIEERHKVQSACDRLRAAINRIVD